MIKIWPFWPVNFTVPNAVTNAVTQSMMKMADRPVGAPAPQHINVK